MFEDFRKQIEDDSFRDDTQHEETLVENIQPERKFLGMTPIQRFIVAFLLFLMVIVLGVLFLLVTYKIVPPFLG